MSDEIKPQDDNQDTKAEEDTTYSEAELFTLYQVSLGLFAGEIRTLIKQSGVPAGFGPEEVAEDIVINIFELLETRFTLSNKRGVFYIHMHTQTIVRDDIVELEVEAEIDDLHTLSEIVADAEGVLWLANIIAEEADRQYKDHMKEQEKLQDKEDTSG